MKTYQLLIGIAFLIGSMIGIFGQFEFYVPFLTDFLNAWIHLFLCAFAGLFGLALIGDVIVSAQQKLASANRYIEKLRERIKNDAWIHDDRIKKHESNEKDLNNSIAKLIPENIHLKDENECLKEELETLSYFSEKMKKLKAENKEYRKRLLSYQGNLAQMSRRYKALKHAEKHVVD